MNGEYISSEYRNVSSKYPKFFRIIRYATTAQICFLHVAVTANRRIYEILQGSVNCFNKLGAGLLSEISISMEEKLGLHYKVFDYAAILLTIILYPRS